MSDKDNGIAATNTTLSTAPVGKEIIMMKKGANVRWSDGPSDALNFYRGVVTWVGAGARAGRIGVKIEGIKEIIFREVNEVQVYKPTLVAELAMFDIAFDPGDDIVVNLLGTVTTNRKTVVYTQEIEEECVFVKKDSKINWTKQVKNICEYVDVKSPEFAKVMMVNSNYGFFKSIEETHFDPEVAFLFCKIQAREAWSSQPGNMELVDKLFTELEYAYSLEGYTVSKGHGKGGPYISIGREVSLTTYKQRRENRINGFEEYLMLAKDPTYSETVGPYYCPFGTGFTRGYAGATFKEAYDAKVAMVTTISNKEFRQARSLYFWKLRSAYWMLRNQVRNTKYEDTTILESIAQTIEYDTWSEVCKGFEMFGVWLDGKDEDESSIQKCTKAENMLGKILKQASPKTEKAMIAAFWSLWEIIENDPVHQHMMEKGNEEIRDTWNFDTRPGQKTY